MKNIIKNKYITNSLLIILGVFIGWLFFHSAHKDETKNVSQIQKNKESIWTCAMHPQIKMHAPGKCPICGMELIALTQNDASIDSEAIHLSAEAIQLANITTSIVTSQKPIKELRLYGKIQADERLLQSQVAHIPGRIEKLFVNFTGEGVQKGQPLAVVYSPELITAQQELLEATKTKQLQPEIYHAAKERLHQWKLSDSQITNMENSGKVQTNFDIISNVTGIVTARRINNGDYISQGSVLYDMADLSSVWVLFDAYENDLPFLNQGDKILFTVQALPGINFSGNIRFIDPVIDPVTRVSKVRVELNNQSGKLKPDMFVTGIVKANLNEYRGKLIIPSSAVLWTGKRSIVYVRQTNTSQPIFKIREIELGPMLGSSYIIINGLKDGEEIVTQGAFSVDAAAQLEGKPSMMSRETETSKQTINTANNTETNFVKTSFKVFGNCDQCKKRIEIATLAVKGVQQALWNMKTKIIQIQYNAAITNTSEIQKAIALAGHDTEKEKASNNNYNKLPKCCLYRK